MKKHLISLLTLSTLALLPAGVFAADDAAKTSATIVLKETPKALEKATESKDAWGTDFEAAKKLAAEKKLPILVDFTGSDWCGWCIRLDKEVFSQAAFKTYAKDNLVLFKADFPRKTKLPAAEKKQNDALAQKYGIKGFPTILLLDAKENILAKTGYQQGGADAYVKHLKNLVAKAKK